MEVSVFELLAAAREIQGTDYVDGDGIMCGKRYDKQTAHMIEFSFLEALFTQIIKQYIVAPLSLGA